MREQSSNEHHLPVLDEQTVRVLMRQILGRQDIELLKFQVHRASDWTGPATSGVYHLTGSGGIRSGRWNGHWCSKCSP